MKLAETIRYRAAIYASVHVPPETISRAQATDFYNRLADEGFPQLSLEYVPSTESSPFKVLMREKEGRRTDTIVVDVHQKHGLRLLVDQAHPESFEVACRKADIVAKLYSPFVSDRQADLVEARIRAQVSTGKKSAIDYLIRKLVKDSENKLTRLGSMSHFGIRYEIAPEFPAAGPLSAPKREVQIEQLREETGSLHVEVMSNWGRMALKPIEEKPGEAQLVQGPLSIRREEPSRYLREISEYIEGQVCPFLEEL